MLVLCNQMCYTVLQIGSYQKQADVRQPALSHYSGRFLNAAWIERLVSRKSFFSRTFAAAPPPLVVSSINSRCHRAFIENRIISRVRFCIADVNDQAELSLPRKIQVWKASRQSNSPFKLSSCSRRGFSNRPPHTSRVSLAYIVALKEGSNQSVNDSLGKKVARGGAWIMALKAAGRGLGLIRTVVLARLLLPEDFGLLGIALLTVGIVETFSSTGFKSALIQKKESIAEYLDTAWTATAFRGIFLSVLLFTTAPFVAEFFQTPEAVPVIQVIAATVLMNGFRNIGMVYFERDLIFHKQFIYEIAANLINLIVSIILAFHLRSVWALVWGGLSADIFKLFFSYVIHPYVPKFRIELEKVIDLFRFGKWVFLSGILVFLITQGDDLFVAKFLGISALAYYQMAFMVSNLPTTEISHVISNVTFPAYSKDAKRC